jgi:hypothetical protein
MAVLFIHLDIVLGIDYVPLNVLTILWIVLDAETVHYSWDNNITPRLTIDAGDTVIFRRSMQAMAFTITTLGVMLLGEFKFRRQ